MSEYRVFLSSTLDDLRQERDAVKKVLQQYCIIKESYFASDDELAKSVRDDVAKCDLYIGILGARYGHVPEEPWNVEKRSLTELEYESAEKSNVPRLMFIKTKSSIPMHMSDFFSGHHGKQRIEEFRRRVASEQRPAEFSTAEELASSVVRAFWEFKSKRERLAVFAARPTSDAQAQSRLRIFLCHSSRDKARIRLLCKQLVGDGFDPWLDELKLLPGQKWEEEIPKAVRSSDVVLVCMSRDSISKAGYVQKDIAFALDVAAEQPEGRIFLIPARLEECEVPGRLRDYQWVDLFDPQQYELLLHALRERARDLARADLTLVERAQQMLT